MPLRIRLAPGERMIVNGAVIRNEDKRTTITIDNMANVLKGKDVMFADEANTLPKKTYFLVQSLLISPNSEDSRAVAERVTGMMAELYSIDGAQGSVIEAMDHFSDGDYYKTLVALREVISLENETSNSLREKEKDNVVIDEPSNRMEFVRQPIF